MIKSKPGSMMEKVMIFENFLVPKCAKMGPTPTQKPESDEERKAVFFFYIVLTGSAGFCWLVLVILVSIGFC